MNYTDDDIVIKRPRGRPKGSKNKPNEIKSLEEIGKKKSLTKENYRKNHYLNVIEYDPSDMKQTLSIMNEFRRMAVKRPSNGEELFDRFNQYLLYCEQVGFKPTMESWCVAGGFTREAFRSWKAGTRGDKSMQDVALQISEAFAAIDADLAMNNKVYPATYIFRAKNYHGMKDETEVTVTPNNPLGEVISVEEIEKKYEYLPED